MNAKISEILISSPFDSNLLNACMKSENIHAGEESIMASIISHAIVTNNVNLLNTIKIPSYAVIKSKVGNAYTLIQGNFCDSIWKCIPLQSHEILSPEKQKRIPIIEAIDHIETYHCYISDLFLKFTKNIAFVDLKKDYLGKDTTITSSSFPLLPLTVFLSPKALKHIPPNTVSDMPSYRLLAENLLHEAIHQQVNLTLVEKDIFCAEYSSELSPKIQIEWRKKQGIKRNQAWELDRVLHAITVYVNLVKFRRKEVVLFNTDNLISQYIKSSLPEGLDALDYLSKSLLLYKNFFTENGYDLVSELRKKALVEISKAKKLCY